MVATLEPWEFLFELSEILGHHTVMESNAFCFYVLFFLGQDEAA